MRCEISLFLGATELLLLLFYKLRKIHTEFNNPKRTPAFLFCFVKTKINLNKRQLNDTNDVVFLFIGVWTISRFNFFLNINFVFIEDNSAKKILILLFVSIHTPSFREMQKWNMKKCDSLQLQNKRSHRKKELQFRSAETRLPFLILNGQNKRTHSKILTNIFPNENSILC